MTADDRPDPDDLVARAHDAGRAVPRGRLKVFFGAAAGVGKTSTMLAQARTRWLQGADIVIGVVETHGRAETAALVGETPVVPLRAVVHQGRALHEFDLDAVLARAPALVLVDELAHSNITGSRHPKRWQDVEELLAAGIDVWTTMNVQHLESLDDVVSGIAGIRVRETVPDHVFDGADDVELVQVALPRAQGAPSVARRLATLFARDETAKPHGGWRYAMSAALCGVVTLATTPLLQVLELSNIVMLFLLAVVAVALRYGRGPAVLASFVSVAAFDFFDVAPRFTFAVGDVQYLVTFGVMLIVALVIGQLTAGLTWQARVAALREDRVRALYEMSRDLAAALMPEQIVEIGTRVLQAQFDARAVFLLLDADDRLVVAPDQAQAGVDASLAVWALQHGEAAGRGTNTLPGNPMLYVPLKAPMRVRGVVALALKNPHRLDVPEQRRLLDTFASLLAIALERMHYVDVAQRATVQMASERLRNALLGAISHDLRTPLAALAGMADSLQLTAPPLLPQHAEIAQALREAAVRMNALVANLLDMARLEAGRVALNPEWQPLEEVVGSALRGLAPLFAGRHPLKVELPADLPLLRIDAVLIERVFANLLENAAKYTPAGSAIAIGAAAAGDTVDVWVADDGPGLPPGGEERIFEKFERGRKESATPGVGLGLAICRAIVAAHGGTIRGETRAQGGARFVFTLPRGEPPALPGIAEAEAEAVAEDFDDMSAPDAGPGAAALATPDGVTEGRRP